MMLKQRFRISENRARKLILSMAKYSDHSKRHMTDPLNTKQIELWFKQNGYSFEKLINDVRTWGTTIPLVENIANDIFFVECQGSSVETSVIESGTGEIVSSIDNSGIVNISDYKEKYRSSLKSKESAITNIDIQEFYSCLAKSFSAFESYFHYKANIHNLNGREILQDTKSNPVSLDDKFKKWIPIITGGTKIDLGRVSWTLLKKQQEIRHNHAIHPKHVSNSISYDEFARCLNEFRDGIATIFYDLHLVFKDKMKSYIIREIYSPDVYVDKSA